MRPNDLKNEARYCFILNNTHNGFRYRKHSFSINKPILLYKSNTMDTIKCLLTGFSLKTNSALLKYVFQKVKRFNCTQNKLILF